MITIAFLDTALMGDVGRLAAAVGIDMKDVVGSWWKAGSICALGSCAKRHAYCAPWRGRRPAGSVPSQGHSQSTCAAVTRQTTSPTFWPPASSRWGRSPPADRASRERDG